MSKHFLLGVLIGVPAAIAGIIFGLTGMVAAVLAVALISLIPRLAVLFAGGLVGLGGTWFVLFVNHALRCAGPDYSCGSTPPDITPLLVASAVLVAAGGVSAAVTMLRGMVAR